MDPVCYINFLPEEILIQILQYLTQNELARVSRVCRRLYECTRNPIFWKRKIDVKFSWSDGSQNEIFLNFSKNLSSSVTYIKLDFGFSPWVGGLNFEQLCVDMKQKCSTLRTLILHSALFSISLCSLINLCEEFLPHLQALILHTCNFGHIGEYERYSGCTKIEILDVTNCVNITRRSMYTILRMPHLRKLSLSKTIADNYWFNDAPVLSFLPQLECLNLGYTIIGSDTIFMLKKIATNLTELYLCSLSTLNDVDFVRYCSAGFPVLKTICVRGCEHMTAAGIVYLIQKYTSLQNVYVHEDLENNILLMETNGKRPFVPAYVSKLGILKVIKNCAQHEKIEFLLD